MGRQIEKMLARLKGPLLFPGIALLIVEAAFSISLLFMLFMPHPPSVMIAHIAGMTICFLAIIAIAPILNKGADNSKAPHYRKARRGRIKLKKPADSCKTTTEIDVPACDKNEGAQGINRIAKVISIPEEVADDLKE